MVILTMKFHKHTSMKIHKLPAKPILDCEESKNILNGVINGRKDPLENIS